MQDITERLDAELGRAPEARVDVAAAVAAGRRVLRRRRLAAGAAGLVAAVVVGSAAWAGLPGGDGRTNDHPGGVAQQPTVSSDADRAPDEPLDNESAPPFRLERGELASYDPDGQVVVRKGWRVTQRITNPFRRVLPARSVGLELTKGEKAYWYLLDYDDLGMSTASDPASKGFARLQDWVDHQVGLQQGEEPFAFVEFGPGGRLVPIAGVRIVEQRTGVDLGRAFAPASRAAVALLDVDGRRWFVSARRLAGAEPEYFPVDTPAAGTTLDAFIDLLRAQYASGEGVR